MIYFMQPVDGGPVKIGHSEDVDRRRRQLAWGYGKPLTLLKVMPGGREEERAMHDRFAAYRIDNSELFEPSHELMEFIAAIKDMPSISDEYISVKIDKAIVAQARMIAAREGKSISDLLSDMLVQPITKAYGRLLRETEDA